ncbi:uncharacterized protein LOC132705849 isoform X2 [Cylas formicarius]|uniref:uncharacterized protein LOC132705849 isoform X2 n=1 Tax=Cylas formicarius TaxID=197179 RepID=UPI002958D457|nr:uncharacterized protein LOC132705849 isoform X2 [Cylas formicarius]
MCKVHNCVEIPILTLAKYCMIFVGIWKLEFPTKNYMSRRVYDIYSGFVMIYFPLFVSSLCVQFAVSLRSEKSMVDVFQELSFIIFVAIVEVGVILCQSDDFKHIICSIIEEERRIHETRDDELLSYHASKIKFCNAINLTIIVFALGTGSSVVLENFWKRLEVERYNHGRNETVEKHFLFEMYLYKLDPYKYPRVMLAVNYFMLLINVFLIISTKIVFVSCIIFMSSSLTRLQVAFRKTATTSTPLVDLIRQHQHVIRFVKKLNESIRYMILMEYLLNSVNVAAVSIQFIAFEQGVTISPLLYLVYLLVQIFAFGWNAHEIQIQERRILESSDDQVISYHAAQIKFCNAINLMTIFFVIITGVFIILENAWKRQQVEKYINKFNGSAEKPFIYELYFYKFDPHKYSNVMMGVNYLMLLTNILLIISTKIVFVSCIIFASSSLRKLQVGFKKTVSISTRLVDLIRQHQRVIRFVKKLNESIRYMILMEYLLNSANVAAVSIQFIAFEQGIPISPLLYLVYLLVQIFTLGWSANEIQIQVQL